MKLNSLQVVAILAITAAAFPVDTNNNALAAKKLNGRDLAGEYAFTPSGQEHKKRQPFIQGQAAHAGRADRVGKAGRAGKASKRGKTAPVSPFSSQGSSVGNAGAMVADSSPTTPKLVAEQGFTAPKGVKPGQTVPLVSSKKSDTTSSPGPTYEAPTSDWPTDPTRDSAEPSYEASTGDSVDPTTPDPSSSDSADPNSSDDEDCPPDDEEITGTSEDPISEDSGVGESQEPTGFAEPSYEATKVDEPETRKPKTKVDEPEPKTLSEDDSVAAPSYEASKTPVDTDAQGDVPSAKTVTPANVPIPQVKTPTGAAKPLTTNGETATPSYAPRKKLFRRVAWKA